MAERFEIVEKALLKLLEEKKYATLRDILATMNPMDVAGLFDGLDEKQIPLMFRLLPKEQAAETFVEMEPEAKELLIRGFSDNELKEVLDELYVDDAADIVEEMPANVVQRILKHADPEMRSSINQILRYPEDSAGSIMTTEYVSLRPHMTVEEAILRIRRQGVDKETIYTCYVTDERRLLLGIVTVRQLLLADRSEKLSDIMETHIISVDTFEDKEIAAQIMSKYDFSVVPVVDREKRLVGIITFDDALDVMEDEASEDIAKMSAVTPTDKPYLKTTVIETWKARIPWLLLLMISATFTGMIITSFETALASYVVLTAYIPMLMDTGGNSGSQASVTIIRGISLGDIEFSDLPQVIWKEARVAVLCGATLSAANFVKLILLDRVGMAVALVVSLTLLVTVIVAKAVGCTLPILAKKAGFDPTVMASPFITTIVDAISLFIYFTIATHLLGL